jgi:hypothetical protein
MPPIILDPKVAILACIKCQKGFQIEVDPQSRRVNLVKILQHMDECFSTIGGLRNCGMIRRGRN